MRSLVFVTVVILFLSVAMGISFHQHQSRTTPAGRQIASFSLEQSAVSDWLCQINKKNLGEDGTSTSSAHADDCQGIEEMPFPEMRSKLLLRTMQTLHDVFNNQEDFPASVLPSPLNLLQKVKRPENIKEGREMLEPIHEIHTGAHQTKYPYFGFIPLVDAVVNPGGPNVTYVTPCFAKVVAQAQILNSSMALVTITTSGQKSLFCTDSVYLMGGVALIGEIKGNGVTQFHLDTSKFKDDEARVWLLKNRGIIVGRIAEDWLQFALDLISTVVMLVGFAEPQVGAATFKANTDFVQNYIQFNSSRMGKIQLRNQDYVPGHFVAKDLDPDVINSGDVFMIIRPDGLEPVVSWVEGTSAGHVTIAMRSPTNNTLYVCESTTKDAYWPVNGIQCQTWSEWWPWAHKAQFNVLWLPLNETVRTQFNVQKAWDFFYENEGYNYGFLQYLAGWLDMKHGDGNSPCVPPDFTQCFNRPIMSHVIVALDVVMGNSRSNFFRQGFAHRVNLWPQQVSVAHSIMYGQMHLGLNTISDLYSIVEQDDWLYNTTRYGEPATGRSMICNVFVCQLLKKGGVFDSINKEIQCGESNPWTIYASNLWDSAKMGSGRPEICKTADPQNPLCQLMGNWTFTLHPDLNSRPIYANMSNHCPSTGPNYIYPEGC